MFFFILSFLMLTTEIFGYDEKYDKLDVDKIIADDKLLMSYLNCFLDKGPCTNDFAEEFKEILPEVLSTACGKCSEIQKKNLRKLINTIFEKKPEVAIEIQKKYDPNLAYKDKIAEFLASGK